MLTTIVRLVATLLLGLGATAAAGAAQSRIDGAPGAVRQVRGDSETAGARALRQFTRCSGRIYRRSSEALLAMPYGSREQARAVRGLYAGHSECYRLGPSLAASPLLVAGGLAEYYVLNDFDLPALDRIAALTDDQVDASRLAPRNGSEDMALCIVRRDPHAGRDLLSAEPGSEAEGRLIRGLVPHLAPCAPAGLTLNVDPPALRALLAAGLYRALVATR